MTRKTGYRDQARAAFLAALMVLSVVGGSMAFAGTAAATASGLSISDSAVQSGVEVTVSATADTPGNDMVFVIDKDGDGAIDAGEQIGVVTSDSTTGEASVKFTPGAALADGSYTVYVREEANSDGSDDTSYPVGSPASYYGDSATLVVDDSPPSGSNAAPTGTVSDATPTITLDIASSPSQINTSTIEVEIRDTDTGKQLFYRLDATEADGVSFSSGTLTIDIAQSKLSELPDDNIQVNVDAKDEAGNALTGTTSFNFDVDTNPVTATLGGGSTPTDGEVLTSTSQTIYAEVSSTSADIDTAEVTISGDGYSETLTTSDSVYSTGSPNTFTIDAGSSGDIPALPQGEVTVTVTATDKDGKTDSDSRTFTVDTHGPGVESITVNNGNPVNVDNADSVPVVVQFNESVDPATIAGEVQLDDDATAELTLGSASYSTNTNGDEVTFDLDLTKGNTEAADTDSAEVTVTSAEDVNGQVNSSVDTTATFNIDNDAPVVSEKLAPDDLPRDNGNVVFSGVVDIAGSFSLSNADGGSLNYYIQSDKQGDYVDLSTIDDLKDFDTTKLPEGTHELKVNATDNAGNVGEKKVDVIVDNADPSVSYTGPETITGEVDISNVVSVSDTGTEDVTFGYTDYPGYGATGTFVAADSIDVNQYGDGDYTFAVQVDNPGYGGASNVVDLETMAVSGQSLEAGDFSIDAEENANDAGKVNLTVTSAVDLTGLNVTASTDDNYYKQSSEVLNLEKFTMNSSPTQSGDYEYTRVYDAPRDGAYSFAIDNASMDAQSIETVDDADDSVAYTVDNETVSVVDADLVSADRDQIDVRVRFSEPVASIGSVDNFDGNTVSGSAQEDGEFTVTVQGMAQTGGDEELTFNNVVEAESDGAADTTTSTGADVTFALELSQGVNVVSVPAETGSVPISELDLSGVKGIWAYDNGGWQKYIVATGEGQLDSLEGGQGYVVRTTEQTEIDMNVENVPSTGDSGAQEMGSENLNNGWNLVGHFQEGDQSVAQALTGLTGDYSVQKGYTGEQVDTLEAGQGYWLYTNADSGILVPVSYTGMQSAQPTLSDLALTTNGGSVDAGEDVGVQMDISHDIALQKVVVYSDELGINGQTIATNPDTGNDVDLGSATASSPLPVWADGTADVRVAVVDINGNVQFIDGTVSVDDSAATVSSIDLLDTDSTKDGNIDTAEITFSEPVDDSTFSASDFTIAGTTAGSIDTGDSADDATIKVSLSDDSGVGSASVDVTYSGSATDMDGNSISSIDTPGTDSASPVVTAIETIDRDADGKVDAANIDFSEAVDTSTLVANDFTIGGTQADAKDFAAYGSGDDSKVQIQLTLDSNEVSGTDAKAVTYTQDAGTDADVADAAGNLLANFDTGAAGSTLSVSDGAAPVMSISSTTATNDEITVTFSESVSQVTQDDFNTQVSSGGYEAAGGFVDNNDGTYTLTSSTVFGSGDTVYVKLVSGNNVIDSASNNAGQQSDSTTAA